MKQACKANLPALIFLFALLILWQAGAMGMDAAYILPSPTQILSKLWELREPLFTVHLPATMLVTAIGLGISLVLGLLLASLQAVFVPLLAVSAESTPIPILFVCPDFAASVLGNPAKQKLHARFVPSSPDWSVPAAVGVPPADNSAILPEHCRLSAASYSAAVLSTPRRVLPYLSSLDTRHRLLSMHRPADFEGHLPESETAVLDPIHQLPPQRLPA